MKTIFKKYGDWILGTLGICILACIIWFFVWGILFISSSMSQAFGSLGPSQGNNSGFNVDKAQQLDLKGLGN